jgi:hypothetical protein
MRVRMTPESELCTCTKNVLFSSSALLEQRSLQLIDFLLTNSKNWVMRSAHDPKLFRKVLISTSTYLVLVHI